MKQRGRKSASGLTVVPLPQRLERLRPPDRLTLAERAVWEETVNARPADWFGVEQAPLLEAFCRHVIYARTIGQVLRGIGPRCLLDEEGLDRHRKLLAMHERETNAASRLATRMRLTGQSLIDKRVAGRATDRFSAARKPWEVED